MIRRPVIQKELHDIMVSFTRCAPQQTQTHTILHMCLCPTLEKHPNYSCVSGFGREMQRSRLVIVLGIHIRAMLDEYLSQFSMSATRREV